MKAISIRLDARLGRAFDEACQAAGYKKTTLLTRFISGFVQRHSARAAAQQRRKTKRPDPLARAIGLLADASLTADTQSIDDLVYDL